MKISVVMATYNGEKYLSEQLASLNNQIRPADEVVIQDDGSSDSTCDLVETFIAKTGECKNWKIVKNSVNLGYIENFKTATVKATGDIICFCDQDDIWHSDKLQKIEKAFENNPQIQVLCSHFTPFVTGETFSELRDVSKEVNDGSLTQVEFNQKNMFLDSLGCAMAFRREFINETIEYWYSGFAHDEYAWKMGLVVDGLYWLNESLLNRRHHAENVSMRKMRNLPKRIEYLHNYLKSYETMERYLEINNQNPKYLKVVKKQIKSAKLRIGLMENKKFFNCIPLCLKYRDTYQTTRTIPMELYMSVFRKKFL